VKVVMVTTTALAGAPYESAKCLRKYAGLNVRWVAETNRYADGRVFPKDLLLGEDAAEIDGVIKGADVIHIQNDVPQSLLSLIQSKPLLFEAHSCPKRPRFNVLAGMTKYVYTVLQPMQQRTYNLPGLPNMMDPEEYIPDQHSMSDNSPHTMQVVFSPTNDWPSNMLGSKGERDVLNVLNIFGNKLSLDIFHNLPYEENLKRKQSADIVIDDVVNQTFNKTAIEGCCFGTAVISSSPECGGVCSSLGGLQLDLENLISSQSILLDAKAKAREWALTKWHPKNLVQRYIDAYKQVLS
jgi:hypothetical protein